MPTAGVSVRCALIFWTPASSLFEYQCAFCQELFISNKECLLHVTECRQNKTNHTSLENDNNHDVLFKGTSMSSIEDPILVDAPKIELDVPPCDSSENLFEYVPALPDFNDYKTDAEVKSEPLSFDDNFDEAGVSDSNDVECDLVPKKVAKPRTHKKRDQKIKIPTNIEFVTPILMNLGTKLQCDICGIFRAKRKGMITHMKNDHAAIDSALQCPICPRVLKTEWLLKQHQINHMPRFSCEFCGKTFAYQGGLKAHILVHTKERPHPCSICERTFATLKVLQNHEMRHRGERPVKCPDCPMSFVHTNDLKQHQLRHTGERRYGCKVCGKMFARTNGLNSHMNTHTGNRPYVCKHCDRGFHSTAARRCHEKNVHKVD